MADLASERRILSKGLSADRAAVEDQVQSDRLNTFGTHTDLYKVLPTDKIADGDTVGGNRVMGFDTFESSAGSTMNEKARKLNTLGMTTADQKILGLSGKTELTDYLNQNPNTVFTRKGYDKFGRGLIENKELAQHMVESGTAVPTDRYDERLQSIYRAKQEKLRKIDPAKAAAMDLQREYNIERQNPGILGSLRNIPSAFGSGTQQLIAGIGDFALDVVTPGNNTLLDSASSSESANKTWGYDAREAAFREKEAVSNLHQGKYGQVASDVLHVAPEMFAQSVPTIASYFVPFMGEAKAAMLGSKLLQAGNIAKGSTTANVLGKIGGALNKNAGFGASVGSQTNNDIDEYTKNNDGVEPTAGRIAMMTANNFVQMATDKFVAKDIFSPTGVVSGMTDALANAVKILHKNAVMSVAKQVAKTALVMGEEGGQEYYQQWAQILNQKLGTTKYGNLENLMNNKEVQDEAIGAGLMGAGMGVGMHAVGQTTSGVSGSFDKLRTSAPKPTASELRDIEMAGGTTGAPGKYTEVSHPSIDTFSSALKSNDMTTAKTSLDEYQQSVMDRADSGELKEGTAEWVDTVSNLTKLHEQYYKAMQKDTVPKFEAVARDYPRYKAEMEKDPDTLGSSRESLGRNLSDIIGYGAQLDDESMAGLDAMANDLGIDISQYKAEQEALKPFRVSEIKATGKDVGTVAYESLIGENGVQRTYEKMKAAVKAGDKDTANIQLGKLKHFKDTQTSKVAKLQAGLDEYKANPTGKIIVPYSVDDKYKFTIGVHGKIGTPEHAINAANKVINESSKVVETLDKVLQAVQVKAPKEVVQETKEKKTETVKQNKPAEAKEVVETQIEETKPKDVVKDTAEIKEEPTEAEVKAKAKEVREVVRAKRPVQQRKEAIKEVLKRIGVAGKGFNSAGEDLKKKDKNYIQELGVMIKKTVTGKDGKPKQKLQVELNEDVLESMSIAMINWLAQDAESTMKVSQKDIKRMLKIKGDKITASQMKMVDGKGVFRKSIVQSLGQAVMDELGLELPEGTLYNVKQSIITGLGNTLVAYMRDQGMVTESEITAAEWNNANKLKEHEQIKQSIKMIQFNYDTIGEIKEAKQILKVDTDIRYKDHQDKGPQYGKASSRKKHEYRNRTGEISEQDEARLAAQDKIQHNVKDTVYKAYKALGEHGKMAAGWVDVRAIKATTHITTRQAIQAVNNSIERSLDHLEEHIENANGRMYSFNYFMSGNGRDMIDSNTFNPQSDKIHRHMDYTGEVVYINTQEDSRTLELFKIAVLQGLDIKTADKRAVDKMTKGEVIGAWKELMSDETKLAYAESLSDGKVDKGFAKEIAEYAGSKGKMHTIDALVALGDYIYAEKTGNPLGATLQLEVDAVTSGWILALMQSPVFDMETNKEYLAKGGVYLDNEDANYQDRAEAKELDSYETVAEAVNKALGKVSENVLKILPVDRKFAKAPFMTNVTYGAGIDGVKADIVEQYTQNLYDKMASGKEGVIEVAKSLRDMGVHLGAIQNATEYMFDDKMYTAIEKYINNTYGKAVEKALSEKYKAFIDVRNTINKAFEEMFQPYAQKYVEGMTALKVKGNVTAKELKDLEASLVQYIPTIKSPNGTDVQIYSKEKMENIFPDDYTFQTQFLDKDTSGITTQAEIKRIVAAKAAGGVVPIHFIDGAIIGRLLQKFQMTGIYDAGMFNLNDVDNATEMYNEVLIEVSKEYNLLEQVLKAAESSKTVSEEVLQDLKDFSTMANTNRKKIYESDLNVQHFAMDGIAYKQESKTKPMSEAKIEKITQDVPAQVINGIERIRGAMSTEDMNAIIAVIKQFKEC